MSRRLTDRLRHRLNGLAILTTSMLVLFIGCLPPHFMHVRAAERPLVVAYADGDTLYVWRQDAPKPRSAGKGTGPLSRVSLAPSAQRVLFQDGNTFWVAELDRPNVVQVIVSPTSLNPGQDQNRFVLDAAWLDDDTIIFNTYLHWPKRLVKQQPADDLWRSVMSTAQVTRLLDDGKGGAFSVKTSNGKAIGIALVLAGDYTKQTPGEVAWVNASGQNRVRLMQYPAVNSGSSSPLYVQPVWSSDGSGLFVAIPPQELIYATPQPMTSIWRLDLTGKATQLGGVQADFFGVPVINPVGDTLLYARRIGTPHDNQIALFRAKSDGSGEQELVRDQIGKLEPAQWMPDGLSYTFVHGAPGETWAQTGTMLQPIPGLQQPMFGLTWADVKTFVYATAPGGPDELRFAVGIGGTAPAEIASRKTGGPFDARRLP